MGSPVAASRGAEAAAARDAGIGGRCAAVSAGGPGCRAVAHPNIVPIYDAGKIGDSYFIASGLIEGQTLADRLSKEGLSAREAAALIEKLALALHYAHTQGIVHRDIKPANV